MRISINLATRPFVELRPLFARLRIVMASLGVLAIVLFVVLHSATKKAHDAQAKMDALVKKTNAFQQEKRSNEARMRLPQNAAVLDRSRFLNELFTRKSFSWTAVMMDLETVLPTGVQVTSIEPQMTKEGDLIIRLRVAGDRDRAVQLVRNLEGSKRFIAPRLSGEVAQNQDPSKVQGGTPIDPNAVEFDILANYNPLPVHDRKKAVEKDEKAAAKKAETSVSSNSLPSAKSAPTARSARRPR